VGGYFSEIQPRVMHRKSRIFFKKHDITVSEWPGNSPDLNPIENLWSVAKYNLQKLDCTTMTKQFEAIMQLRYQDLKIKQNCKRQVEFILWQRQ